ncbi:MAG TPA: FKBP-type peptidyl-prolyl cis-trans isomerase [Bacteroidia bacterium]|jgi:FKBP-type peptidyl-prolyl cis-trans isomerase
MTNSFSKKLAIAAAGSLLAFTACDKSDRPGYEKSESGLYTKFHNHDENGVKPKEGDVVRVSLVVKNDKDSLLTDSKDPKFNRPGITYYEFPLMKSEFNGSFEEALSTMAVGDSASFLINVDSMYKGKDMPPFMTKGSYLTYEAKLEKIISKEEVEKENKKRAEEEKVMMENRKNAEGNSLANYLAENKVTVKPTASGLYFIERTKGKGPNPKEGDKLLVNYTGRLLDGTVFDTNNEAEAKKAGLYDERRPYEPAEFVVGGLVPGMNEALTMMSEGGKATIILPSNLAYGERGGGPIPPFSPMVFEVEIVKFVK